MRRIAPRSFGVAQAVALTLAVASVLLLAKIASAQQSAQDQYGSPTAASGPVDAAISVLPATGGSLLLGVIGALAIIGASLALRRRAGG